MAERVFSALEREDGIHLEDEFEADLLSGDAAEENSVSMPSSHPCPITCSSPTASPCPSSSSPVTPLASAEPRSSRRHLRFSIAADIHLLSVVQQFERPFAGGPTAETWKDVAK